MIKWSCWPKYVFQKYLSRQLFSVECWQKCIWWGHWQCCPVSCILLYYHKSEMSSAAYSQSLRSIGQFRPRAAINIFHCPRLQASERPRIEALYNIYDDICLCYIGGASLHFLASLCCPKVALSSFSKINVQCIFRVWAELVTVIM